MKKKVAVILPSKQDRHYLDALASEYELHYLYDEHWSPYVEESPKFDAVAYKNRVIDQLRAESIDAVVFSHDFASLVGAIAAEAVGLPGPSVESTFLSLNKYYFRQHCDTGVRHAFCDVRALRARLRDCRLPIYVKPTSLFFSVMQHVVRSRDDIDPVCDEIERNLPAWNRKYRALFDAYLDRGRYPLAADDVLLLEEVVEFKTQVAVEGWCDEAGQPHLWCVSDNNYRVDERANSWLDNNAIPSACDRATRQRLIDRAVDTVRALGIKSNFWNVELWITPDDAIKVTEVNGRMIGSMSNLYRAVHGRVQYPYVVNLALGRSDLCRPVEDAERDVAAGAMYTLSTRKKGRMRDLLDYDRLSDYENHQNVVNISVMHNPTYEVQWRQTGGVHCLARVHLAGRSKDELDVLASAIRRDCLR
jgi:hypothetical protein